MGVDIIKFIVVQIFISVHSTEINKENCVNGKEISSKCSFEIRIKPPLTKSLNCTLKFNQSSNDMIFSNIKFRVKPQEDTKCPLFALDIYEGKKYKRIYARCGGSLDPFNMMYRNVSFVIVWYNNENLIDQETNVEMNLSLSDKKFCAEPLAVVAWDKLHSIWIFAGILFNILSIIGIVMGIMRRKRKGCFKKKRFDDLTDNPHEPGLEESTGNQPVPESELLVGDQNAHVRPKSTGNGINPEATISYGKIRFNEVRDFFEIGPTKAKEKPKEKIISGESSLLTNESSPM